jgi:TonB-linked SusC/RagA family outer membrane protein
MKKKKPKQVIRHKNYKKTFRMMKLALLCLFLGTNLMRADFSNIEKLRCENNYVFQPQQTTRLITGTVFDETGETVVGANVVEKGTTNGVITDAEGKFSMNVRENAIIQISYIGYIAQEIEIRDQTSVQIVIKEDLLTLDEVVVVGYGTMKKRDLTGAVASADLESFRESPNVNIFQSLQGSVSGISIGQVNQSGQEPSIEIRGVSTLSGTKSPLIVVDGIIFNGRFADINPADVQNVEVLKDPSSKAIYGAQAANGVILITTKTGKKSEKTRISYSGSFATSSPTIKTRLLNRDEYLQKVRDLEWRNSYTAESGYTQVNSDWNWSLSELFPIQIAGIEAGNDYNWYDAATQNSYITDHLLGVSGGTENTNYYISVGYTDQQGYIINNDYSRWTARINIDTKITDWLTFGTNTSGAFTDFSGDTPTLGNIASTTPVSLPWDENGDYIINPSGNNIINPLLPIKNDDYAVQARFVGNVYGIVQIPWIKGLSYRINNGYNVKYFKDFNSSIYGGGQTGSANKANAYQFEQTLDHIVTYTRQFDTHSINATLVYGYNKVDYERTGAIGTGYSDLTLSYNNLALAAVPKIESSAWKEASLYQMARLAYNYAGKYLLTATLRRDGYSGFSKNNKTALFPSVGLGWILSEEKFMEEVSFLNHLKLRGSWGTNGNKASRYSSLAVVTAGGSSNYVFSDGSPTYIGRGVTSLANNDLKWEKTEGINLGVDFGFLNNRINGNVDYYNSTTKDLLWNMVLPQTSGFSSVTTNIGEIKNTGIEFYLQGNPIKTHDFTWDIGFTFSQNKNKIVTLLGEDNDGDGKEDDLIASNLFIGKSIGAIYDYRVNGIWQVNDENMPSNFAPGSYRVIDLNDDNLINSENDREILGYKEPAYRFGIQNTFKYKRFALMFFINSIQGGKDGYKAINHPAGYIGTKGNATNANWFDFYDYWSPTRPDAKFATPWSTSPVSGSARLYQQRNFVRLQDISLSYSLYPKLLKAIGMEDLKVYISGKNLLTFTDWDGWDPETGQGITFSNAYPVMKSFCVGLDLSF